MKARTESEITETTRVPLKAVFAAIMLTVTVVGSVMGSWWSVHSDLKDLRERAGKQWGIDDQENWSLRLQNSNPTLKVPEPRGSWHQTGEREREREPGPMANRQ